MDSPQAHFSPSTFELPNGAKVLIRQVQPDDAALLVDMFHHLSERTRRLRFHAYTGKLPQERIWRDAIALSDLDPDRQLALVAVYEQESEKRIVGVARFARATADAIEAEAAVVVCDDFQRMGLGTHLLGLLLPLARSMGIRQIVGWVAAENRHMLDIISKTDLPVRRETKAGETLVTIFLTPNEELPRLDTEQQ